MQRTELNLEGHEYCRSRQTHYVTPATRCSPGQGAARAALASRCQGACAPASPPPGRVSGRRNTVTRARGLSVAPSCKHTEQHKKLRQIVKNSQTFKNLVKDVFPQMVYHLKKKIVLFQSASFSWTKPSNKKKIMSGVRRTWRNQSKQRETGWKDSIYCTTLRAHLGGGAIHHAKQLAFHMRLLRSTLKI